MTVFLVVIGDGSDGDECYVDGVFSTRDKAAWYLKDKYGLEVNYRVAIEEWIVDPSDMSDYQKSQMFQANENIRWQR